MILFNNALSVRVPLITTISLILVAGFLTTNLISYYVSKQSLRDALIDNELPLTSNNIYSEIQRDLLQPVFVSSLMANDTFVKDWLIDGESDPSKMIRYLDEIRKKYDVFTSFLVSEETRNYYHFSGISQVISPTDPGDAWYFRVREIKDSHEINVDLNPEQDNTLTIFINHKVMDDDGRFLAATGVGLQFGSVAAVVGRYKEHFGRNVYFVDTAGKIMVRSEGAMISVDNIHDAHGMGGLAKHLKLADQGFYEYEIGGETMLVSARHIPELKWWVVVEQRESDALTEIRKGLLTNTLVGFAVIALTLFIVVITLNLFHARLEAMATTDKLTGISNRSAFDLTIRQALKRRMRDGKPISILLLDIDHFKKVNDSFGHLEGDRVIREIARVVTGLVREADIVCRWGGEELVILAYDCTLENAAGMAEKIRAGIEKASLANLPGDETLTASLGVTEVRDGDDVDNIFRRADSALYRAKQDGRNCIRRG